MRCEEVREVLPAYVRDGETSLTVRRHVARCPECKQELVRYEALLGAMSSLQSSVVEPPPALWAALVAIPKSAGSLQNVRAHVTRNRNVYLGGAAAAVAVAGTAGALLWRSRRRGGFATA
jgi:anti-sigma factor RsiW